MLRILGLLALGLVVLGPDSWCFLGLLLKAEKRLQVRGCNLELPALLAYVFQGSAAGQHTPVC